MKKNKFSPWTGQGYISGLSRKKQKQEILKGKITKWLLVIWFFSFFVFLFLLMMSSYPTSAAKEEQLVFGNVAGQYIANKVDYNDYLTNIKQLQTSEFSLTLRWAPGENFYQGKTYRIPISFKNPIFTFRYVTVIS